MFDDVKIVNISLILITKLIEKLVENLSVGSFCFTKVDKLTYVNELSLNLFCFKATKTCKQQIISANQLLLCMLPASPFP